MPHILSVAVAIWLKMSVCYFPDGQGPAALPRCDAGAVAPLNLATPASGVWCMPAGVFFAAFFFCLGRELVAICCCGWHCARRRRERQVLQSSPARSRSRAPSEGSPAPGVLEEEVDEVTPLAERLVQGHEAFALLPQGRRRSRSRSPIPDLTAGSADLDGEATWLDVHGSLEVTPRPQPLGIRDGAGLGERPTPTWLNPERSFGAPAGAGARFSARPSLLPPNPSPTPNGPRRS